MNKNKELYPNWVRDFEGLDCDDNYVRDLCIQSAKLIELKKGDHTFHEGDIPHAYLLTISGSIRVQKISSDGREIMLYRVSKGQSCALTTACILSSSPYPAEGVCETNVLAVAISKRDFVNAFEKSNSFRSFVCLAYGNQYSALVNLVTDIAFEPLNMRMARQLLAEADSDDVISLTHKEIAIGLGSVREVATRELNVFRDKGWVDLERGRIVIKNRPAILELLDAIPMCRGK